MWHDRIYILALCYFKYVRTGVNILPEMPHCSKSHLYGFVILNNHSVCLVPKDVCENQEVIRVLLTLADDSQPT